MVVHIVIGINVLADVGGTQTYTHTIADNLVRLGHRVTVLAVRHGLMADQVRAVGAEVVLPEDLPDACDAVISQDQPTAYTLAEKWPDRPQVFVSHSAIFDPQLPPTFPVPGSVVVAMSDRFAQRVEAMAADYEIHRLRQPIDSVRLAPRGAPRARPRRALLLGNYLQGDALDAIVFAWSTAGVEVLQVGTVTEPTLEVAAAIADADIVVGKGRVVLEGMSCGRAVFLYDTFGADGWVTPATYDAIEADAFAGHSNPAPMGPAELTAALEEYDPAMGHVNRELVLKHHQDRRHVEALVRILTAMTTHPVHPVQGLTVSAELARQTQARWRAEMETAVLRRQLDAAAVRVQALEARLAAVEQQRRRRARAARRAEQRLIELGEPLPRPAGGER